MIKNSASIYINGINVTAFTVLPIKWANLLDERLDEMYLSLRKCPFENFKPLTPVEIQLQNQIYFGNAVIDTQTATKRYIVAADENVVENPVGGFSNGWLTGKYYDHDLYIIELTKYLECIVVDTNTITNDLGRNYTNNTVSALSETNNFFGATTVNTPSDFVTPVLPGTFYFDAPSVVCVESTEIIFISQHYYLKITDQYGNTLGTSSEDTGITLTLQPGIVYTATYTHSLATVAANGDDTFIYTFFVVENEYPLKRWTITDVINRLCDIAEPIRQGETPRFQLNATQAALFENVLAPQFSFTKSTFRECLQQCGKIIHGEPRLDIATNADGSFYYEISFDLYGQTQQSNISQKRYISKTVSQNVENYGSQTDSNAENLVNQLDKYSGVIVEPYAGGYKSVRTESLYVRITDENMIIQTQYPIYSIEKLECGFIPGVNNDMQNIDITPYVFESSVYNAQLSSYSSLYPYSKAYAITYTQGQKNLTALNFKPENPVSSIFENYSIINILSAASGLSTNSLTSNINYPLLSFRVTYTPFYNSRVGQTKLNYSDYPYPATLIYNQQANVIETRYFGENIKGTIARIGNVEKTLTYILAQLTDIPTAGQMFDKDYYISAVNVEMFTTHFRCTIALSKDFNRLSQYIGISSVKRFSEVSQTQALERNTLWKEYIVVGDQISADTNSYIGDNMLNLISNAFTQLSNPYIVGEDVSDDVTFLIVQNQVRLAVYNQTGNLVKVVYTINNNSPRDVVLYCNSSPQYSQNLFDPAIYPDQDFYSANVVSANIVTVQSDEYSPITNVVAYGGTYQNPQYIIGANILSDTSFVIAQTFIRIAVQNQKGNWVKINYSLNSVPQELIMYCEADIQYSDFLGLTSVYPTQTLTSSNIITTALPIVNLPVISSAFGNSIAFSWTYEDNYSAGAISSFQEGTGDYSSVSGFFQNNYQYTDYYGRMYYYNFDLQQAGQQITSIDDQTLIATELPKGNLITQSSGFISTIDQNPITIRKDNREKLQCNFQIDFVTNRENLIIGSALAAYCSAVRSPNESLAAKLYVFDEPLNKFIDTLASTGIDLSTIPSYSINVSSASNGQFSISASNFITSGESWAICLQQEAETTTVEDDEGNITTQTIQKGGNVLVAQNMTISPGMAFPTIYFTVKRDIFDRDCWVNNL